MNVILLSCMMGHIRQPYNVRSGSRVLSSIREMPYGARAFSCCSGSPSAGRVIGAVPCNPVHFSVVRVKSNRWNSSSNPFDECNSASSLSNRLVSLGNPVHFSVVRVESNQASAPKIVAWIITYVCFVTLLDCLVIFLLS